MEDVPVTHGMRNLSEAAGTFEHNGKHYPRLQFWQITDAYFADGTMPVKPCKLSLNRFSVVRDAFDKV